MITFNVEGPNSSTTYSIKADEVEFGVAFVRFIKYEDKKKVLVVAIANDLVRRVYPEPVKFDGLSKENLKGDSLSPF
jgi:hypothetical protein